MGNPTETHVVIQQVRDGVESLHFRPAGVSDVLALLMIQSVDNTDKKLIKIGASPSGLISAHYKCKDDLE